MDLSKTTRSINYKTGNKLEDGVNIIGNVTYEFDGKMVGQADIFYHNSNTLKLAKSSIIYEDGITLKEHIEENQNVFTIIGIVFVFLVIGTLHYFLVERPRRKHRRYYNARRKRTHETFDHNL